MPDETTIQVRSYRVCFDLERRIHKFDRWQLPVPYGVPVRGLAYFCVLVVLVLALSRVPVAGDLLGMLHPALRFLVLPVVSASVLTRWEVDGRSAHQAGLAWLRLRADPSRVAAFRAVPRPGPVHLGEVALAPDEHTARMRRCVVHGPARVILRYPVETHSRGAELRVRQTGDDHLWRGKQVELRSGQRLVVR